MIDGNYTMTKIIISIAKGIGSILDIAPEPKIYRHIPRESDSGRLRSDLDRIGRDMNRVICKNRNARRAG